MSNCKETQLVDTELTAELLFAPFFFLPGEHGLPVIVTAIIRVNTDEMLRQGSTKDSGAFYHNDDPVT